MMDAGRYLSWAVPGILRGGGSEIIHTPFENDKRLILQGVVTIFFIFYFLYPLHIFIL